MLYKNKYNQYYFKGCARAFGTNMMFQNIGLTSVLPVPINLVQQLEFGTLEPVCICQPKDGIHSEYCGCKNDSH